MSLSGCQGTKKRSVAHFFKLLAAKIPAAVAAMSEEPRSAIKTFDVLRNMLEIATFPAYNITLDLGYYDRTLCDEDQFHYIGPGALPAVHFLRAEPWQEQWVQVKESSSLKAGQRVRQVVWHGTPALNVKTEAQTSASSMCSTTNAAATAPTEAAAARWVYGVALSGTKARQASPTLRIRWNDLTMPSANDQDHRATTDESGTEMVVHNPQTLFKRVLRPPVGLPDKMYMEIMGAIRDALPDLFAAIVRRCCNSI